MSVDEELERRRQQIQTLQAKLHEAEKIVVSKIVIPLSTLSVSVCCHRN